MRSFEAYAARDIGLIANACARDLATFKRAALVCMLSARRPFEIVSKVVDDVQSNGRASIWPSAAQWRGISWIETNGAALRDSIIANRDNAPLAMLAATQCPALGLAKGGFLCQMMGVDVGCLDTHNVDKYELDRSALRLNKGARELTRLRHLTAYVDLCQNLGGSNFLWGAWCEYLATLYPDVYRSGDAVSRLHVAYVDGIPF